MWVIIISHSHELLIDECITSWDVVSRVIAYLTTNDIAYVI